MACVERAARDGAKLIVLPEGTVPGYVLGDEPVDETLLNSAANDVANVARANAVTIVYGGAKIVHGETFNAAICIGPGGVELGFAAKQFLWHFDRRWFAAGATLDPIDTPIGKLGLLVCADGRIPTIAATLVERGARVLVMPTAWVTSGRDPAALENIQADLMANVRARENGVPFVVANKCGVELESVAYCGKSAIVDAAGAFVARGNERDEGIVAGTIVIADEPRVERVRANAASLGHEAPGDSLREERMRARIAFAFATDGDVERFARLAAQADAEILITHGATATAASGIQHWAMHANDPWSYARGRDFPFARVDARTLRDPRGLVPARLDGVDLFVTDTDGDPQWSLRIARTRAAELRAFVVVFDAPQRRAYAVDPDGVVLAGTFDDFRLAAFVYDKARTHATMVAPRTDVLEGLRIAESLRTSRVKVNA